MKSGGIRQRFARKLAAFASVSVLLCAGCGGSTTAPVPQGSNGITHVHWPTSHPSEPPSVAGRTQSPPPEISPATRPAKSGNGITLSPAPKPKPSAQDTRNSLSSDVTVSPWHTEPAAPTQSQAAQGPVLFGIGIGNAGGASVPSFSPGGHLLFQVTAQNIGGAGEPGNDLIFVQPTRVRFAVYRKRVLVWSATLPALPNVISGRWTTATTTVRWNEVTSSHGLIKAGVYTYAFTPPIRVLYRTNSGTKTEWFHSIGSSGATEGTFRIK